MPEVTPPTNSFALPMTKAIQDMSYALMLYFNNAITAQLWTKVHRYDKAFTKETKAHVPFDCIKTYDAKGWEYMKKYGKVGDWFWNVARNMPKADIKPSDVDSERKWGDKSDMDKYL